MKKIPILLAVAMLVAALSGCGGAGSDGAETTKAAASASETATGSTAPDEIVLPRI